MARLAAYYQEDFHYAPIGYGPKQRKAAYIVYEEPKNNIFENSYLRNGSRLRALAASEPILTPSIPYSTKSGRMTLKQRSDAYDSQLAERSQMAVQRLENAFEKPVPNNYYLNSRYQPDAYDCESLCSYSTRSVYDNQRPPRCKSRLKDVAHKRLSYADKWSSSYQPQEFYITRTGDRYLAQNSLQAREYDPYIDESLLPAPSGYLDQNGESFQPLVSYSWDSGQEKWQQLPWPSPEAYPNPALLSPPSPLDSGLSSQSITSSPSLEAEPIPVNFGPLPIPRSAKHPACSCSRKAGFEQGLYFSPSRYDSGRSSPGAHSTISRCSGHLHRTKKCPTLVNNKVNHAENDFDDSYGRGQVRYGMMGLLGEPVNGVQIATDLPKPTNGYDCVSPKHVHPHCHQHAGPNGVMYKAPGSHVHKHHKPASNYVRPCVVITEASEKSSGSRSSPEQDNSDKSPEPESSMSFAVSNSASNSSSVTSSNNELDNEERRKTNKATEKEIRELEDMYKKCNLSDNDLLERAERRDLPSAHQTKINQVSSRLSRSKSDTLYEMSTPTFCNPYEKPKRAPPYRRSGIPDTVADDMAIRKLSKPVTTSSFNPADSTVTYMLCSSHFTPTVPATRDILLVDDPDVEYDDLCYRRNYHGKKSKIMDPQPPFGIPLRPPPPQSIFSDYLHAVPDSGPQPLCHPRGNPDVVRDDMAFRTLRKDEPERMYYDPTLVYKKKRG